MANYGFYVANTGSTLYSGFTFLDSQGNNVTINIPPSQTFYVSASDVITGSTYTNLDITLIGNLDINYDFSACCTTDSFSIELPNSFSGLSGSSYYVYFGSFTNSTDVAYGCYNITLGGPSYSYVTALSFDDLTPYIDCTDCTNTNQCNIDECCLLLSVEYSGGYYYRTLYNEGIINGRQFYTFPNITGGTIVMYWSFGDWNMDNITTSVARGSGSLTAGYCPSFTLTTIDNALNCLSDLTASTINLSAELISCSGCSPIYCINDTGLGYDDTFLSAGTHNSETYWSGITNGYLIYFTTGGTWCLSTTLDGVCLLEGPYPCISSCPDLCDNYVFSGNCPTPTPTPTVNCSVLDFSAIFDCEVTPTPSVTPTNTVTPTITPTPSTTPLCPFINVDVTITGYTPTPTPTPTVTPTLTPIIDRPCNIIGNVNYTTIENQLICPVSRRFVDCSNGQIYFTNSGISTPSGDTLTPLLLFKADVDGVSKCVVYTGLDYDNSPINSITLVDGPLGDLNIIPDCSPCTPDVSPTPTPSPTLSPTPTLTLTPTSSSAIGFYTYKECGSNTYIIQTNPGPATSVGSIFRTTSGSTGLCFEYISYTLGYPSLPPSSSYTYWTGNYFPTSGILYFPTCTDCIFVTNGQSSPIET
jgi:hypothetical protein